MRLAVAAVAFIAMAATMAAPVSATGPQHQSSRGPARAILARAVRAAGGADALQGLERFQITASGATRIGYETTQPDGLAETTTYDRVYGFDLDDDQLRVDTNRVMSFEAFQFTPPQSFSRVLDGQIGGITEGAGGLVPPGTLPSAAVGALRRQQLLFNPHLVLRHALDNPNLVSDGGRVRLGRRVHNVLVVADEVGDIRLFVDRRTGRISRLETTESHPLVRDTTIEVRYRNWRRANQSHDSADRWGHHHGRRQSLRFPTEIEVYADGALIWEETRSAVHIDPTLPDGHFALPPGTDPAAFDPDGFAFGTESQHLQEGFFALGVPYDHRPGLAPPTELAPGVNLLSSSHNSVAISHDDGIIMLDAPLSPGHASEILRTVDQLAPGLPITHVVQSHHHVDHASGVRSLVATGATAVVGHGVGDFWAGVLAAPSTIRPDALSESGVTGVIEELGLNEHRVLVDDEDLTVTLHHTTFDPHAGDAIITTIETGGQLFVYQVDTYNTGFGFTLVIDGPQATFDAFRDLGIIDQDCQSALPLTIVPGHGIPLSLADSLAELATLGIDVGC